MTLEELRALEAAHPEYKALFPMIMKEFDEAAREEFGKAFAAINERMQKRCAETSAAHNVPEEDVKAFSEAFTDFLKQVNDNFVKNVGEQFRKNAPQA